jgi:enoyl-CoA hydratase
MECIGGEGTEVISGERITAERIAHGVAVARVANPPHGLMDDVTEAELAALVDAVEADEGLVAVVLTGGQPGVFIRHYDVGILEKRSRAMAARGLRFDASRAVPEAVLHRCQRRIESSPKIWIAALNGTTMGGGFELALACDLRIAQDGQYRIGLPESNLGLLPGAGGTQRLPRLVGEAQALEWMLLGRTFGPHEAAQLGLVNRCCEGDALGEALAIATRLAARNPRALAHIKRLVRIAPGQGDAKALADERTLFCDLMVDPRTIDAMAGMNRGDYDIIDGPVA